MLWICSKLAKQVFFVVGVLFCMLMLLHFSSRLPDDYPLRFIVGRPEYYEFETQPQFPPLETISHEHPELIDLCSNFPVELGERVQVTLKTGSGQNRLSTHLATDTSCFANLLIVSDLEEEVQGRKIHDVLAGLGPGYWEHEDFAPYLERQQAGPKISEAANGLGWKLDRFKFLPMINLAHEKNPAAEWYMFLEDDVYIFWDNLFRFLSQKDSSQPHYFGSATAGAYDRWFAYGGGGFVLSHALMEDLVGDGTTLSDKYQQMTIDDCCGDAVVAYAIFDKTGDRLEDVYPMFSGEELEGTTINKARWCTPLISLHRVRPDEMLPLWQWERTRAGRQSQRPLVFSDLLAYRLPFLQNSSRQSAFENLSDLPVSNDSEAHQSPIACSDACKVDELCLQYQYANAQCRHARNVTVGNEVGDPKSVAGWDRRKLMNLGLDLDEMSTACRPEKWKIAKKMKP